MKIYTKTGDRGETGLFGGGRVRKNARRIRAYGEVDEANAALGQARALCQDAELKEIVIKIQNDLFNVGAILATPDKKRLAGRTLVTEEDVVFLEKTIDRFEADLPPLKKFILPGGSPLAASLQVARAVVRRAEREVVALQEEAEVDEVILRYINRLSDLLFVLARRANRKAGVDELPWEQKGR